MRLFTKFISGALIAAILLSVLPFSIAGAQEQTVPRFEPADCMFAVLTPGEVECGYLIVPEEHANPTGNTIRLAVATFKSTSNNPAPDPLVMAQGGPGGSTIDIYSEIFMFGLGDEVLAQRDVILLEQRGTYYSEPSLVCPEVIDSMIDMLDQNLTIPEVIALDAAANQTCHTRLLAEGVNLSAFDSVENAADIAALRETLGYEEYDFYGVSYGTLLAQHLIRNHPEGLRSVIMDATLPTSVNFIPNSAQSFQRSFDLLFANCGADTACNTAYPNLETTFYDLVASLDANPVTFEIQDPDTQATYTALLDGENLIGIMASLLYISAILPQLPKLIIDIRDGNYSLLQLLLPQIIFDRTMSVGMFNSVICAEDADYKPEDMVVEGVDPILAALFEVQSQLDLCALWNVEPLDAAVDEPVTSDIPTLILSGEFDPITPPAYGEIVHKTLPNSYFYIFPGESHGVFLLGGDCPNQMALAFLQDPTTEPDASCMASAGEPTFTVANAEIVMESVTLDTMDIEVAVPQGWDEMLPGLYQRDGVGDVALAYQAVPGAGLVDNIGILASTLGAADTPELLETREANGLSWSIYRFEVQGITVTMGVTETEDMTYLILLQSTANERDTIFEQVFVPAINGFSVIE